MARRFALAVLAGAVFASALAAAGDWPQWRGPRQNGVGDGAEELADSWPAAGPKLAWKSPKIPGAAAGGFSSVSVVGDRAFLFVNWKSHVPIATRKLDDGGLRRLGWTPVKLPADLARAVEEARLSPERAKLKGPELKAWVDKWVAEKLPADANAKSRLLPIVTERLLRGDKAFALEDLERVSAIKDKQFESAAAMEKWLAEANLPAALREAVVKEVPTTVPQAQDVIVCLSTADGNILWQREYPGLPAEWGSSSTPCVAEGRLYVCGSKTLYCLRADDGNEIWARPMKATHVSSSPVVVGGVVAVLAGELTGFNTSDGNVLWVHSKVRGNNASPVVWKKDGKAHLLCNNSANVSCVDPATGKLLWDVPGGGSGTVALGEGAFAVLSERKEVGVVAYKLSAERPERLWSQPFADRGTTPIISGGCLYGIGSGKAFCLRMSDGNVAWEHKYACEISSPVLAGGRLLGLVEGGSNLLMIRAIPDKFDLLGRFKLKAASCSSPVVADGRLYLRMEDGVACYDLRKQ